MTGLIVPEKDLHDRCVIEARLVIEEHQEPLWFRDHYYGECVLKELARFGLSTVALATHALALHICYETPSGSKASDIKRRLKAERARLQKARRGLSLLAKECRPKDLETKCSTFENVDGSVEITSWEDPYVEILDAIDGFLQRSAGIAHQGGGRKAVLHHAVVALVGLLERNNQKLPPIPELERLCHELFEKVEERHPERRRRRESSYGDPISYKDMLHRIHRDRKTRSK